MVLNAAVQMLREADELKEIISKFKKGTSMLQERSLWASQQQLQKVYQKVLVLDLDYALDKKVEQDLWNIGFKQQIEALQAISKDRKNALRSEGQAMLSWVLQAAAGFYLCLLHQICTTFKLDLPFRRRASLLGWVEGWGAAGAASGARLPAAAAAQYICQHCLVHLGDLARYRHQLRVAYTFYKQAVTVSAESGQPYNQLGLVARVRGRRLGAVYWHVRALLVRVPFPPATDNLERTLRSLHTTQNSIDLPVLPGVTRAGAGAPTPAPAPAPARLDAHSYVTELIRALYLIHTMDELDTATSLVNSLNSQLTALIATDSFESMTLIKMACVLIWMVHSATEGLRGVGGGAGGSAAEEARAGELACALAAGALLALLLPAYSRPPPPRALPALKVLVQWTVSHPQMVRSQAWAARPALWPALAHTLNALAPCAARAPTYETVPLPEDEELNGFLPLEEGMKGLRFHTLAAWDTYGDRVPDVSDEVAGDECLGARVSREAGAERGERARRLRALGSRLALLAPQHFSCVEEDDTIQFTAAAVGGEQLSRALAELSAAAREGGEAAPDAGGEGEDESDDEPTPPPPPIVISEADFREKVREKRVGILKPQGSLERAREERALACTAATAATAATADTGDTSGAGPATSGTASDDQEQEVGAVEENKCEDKKEARKTRVNIAMAAIMRKQEETNKQVKFVSPPPTPDSNADSTESTQEKPKVIQPKAIKSLANIPIGRKTGGILSLKDKSAGYPHLVNTDPEPVKKNEKEEKKEPKTTQTASQNSQTYQPKRQDLPPSPSWSGNVPQNFHDPLRMGLQKNYGIQTAGISFNPNYQPANVNNQGIRLPVVNPKEIDVRTAALQKQNSRQELFQDGSKFGNQNYQISSDKKNFLNDLPPRFANQYRYWQTAQENQFNDNKFRDDTFATNNSLFNAQQQPRTNWVTPQVAENYPQPMSWWKPENPPNFNANYSMTVPPQPNFYTPHLNPNMSTPYQSLPTYNPMLPTNMGQQNKPEAAVNPPSYLQSAIGQPQLQTLQNLANFNPSLNSFGTYAPTVGYDSSMYPQFNTNKLSYQPLQMKGMDTPQVGYQGNKEVMDIGFGSNVADVHQKNMGMNFGEPLRDVTGLKNLDQTVGNEGTVSEAPSNTYSLFSGAPNATAWGPAPRHPPQSLWSGPGPSPLERLLEQQKQMKPPAPQ